MGKKLIFDWMCVNDVMAHVECDAETGEVQIQNFTDIKHQMFFCKQPVTIQHVIRKLEMRCPPRGRPDIKEILEYYGLSQYSVLDIVRKTHAHCNRDDLWMRFEGETLKYQDINICRTDNPYLKY